MKKNSTSGITAATFSYILWGFLPIYWKELKNVPAYEILCHRVIWSLFFTLGLILLLGRGRSLWQRMKKREEFTTFTIAALLLACNWLVYIWAINAGYVIEASLGYFINPLLFVLLGVVYFREKLRPGQIGALILAVCGVLFLTFFYGKFPWIALFLATSFSIYGLLHKQSNMPALESLCLEAVLFFLPAFCLFIFFESSGTGSFFQSSPKQMILLIGTGAVTSLPLLLFGFAAKKITLSLVGLLQYIEPTISLFLGIFLYHEDFSTNRMIGFMFIWAALIIYKLENSLIKLRAKAAKLRK